jgi:hypothetical protein
MDYKQADYFTEIKNLKLVQFEMNNKSLLSLLETKVKNLELTISLNKKQSYENFSESVKRSVGTVKISFTYSFKKDDNDRIFGAIKKEKLKGIVDTICTNFEHNLKQIENTFPYCALIEISFPNQVLIKLTPKIKYAVLSSNGVLAIKKTQNNEDMLLDDGELHSTVPG